jgi:DNA-binding PadR family transcriptional regulator
VDRLLLLLQQHALSPKELQAALGLKHRPTFRANYLYPALKQKLIAMTLPDEPTSPKQTYQLTELGKIHVQQLLRQSE